MAMQRKWSIALPEWRLLCHASANLLWVALLWARASTPTLALPSGVAKEVGRITGEEFVSAPNKFEALAAHDAAQPLSSSDLVNVAVGIVANTNE